MLPILGCTRYFLPSIIWISPLAVLLQATGRFYIDTRAISRNKRTAMFQRSEICVEDITLVA